MKNKFVLSALCLAFCGMIFAQRLERMPYADFEHWTVRYIHESKLLGGKTRTLYAVAPTDTIDGNKAFKYQKDGNPWSVSSAYANVAGIVKGSGSIYPEWRDKQHGYCCRMDCAIDGIRVLGMIDVYVFIAGTLFTGETIEPIKDQNKPYEKINFGTPFTKRPTAIVLDYKAIVSPDQEVIRLCGLKSSKKVLAGHDEPEFIMYLQKRWEDAEGNIYSQRIGTAYERITKTQSTWQNAHRVPVHYGDITDEPFYKDYMRLGEKGFYARNSKGVMKKIKEVSWGAPNDTPTHMIMLLTSGKYPAFTGKEGNTLWVDNVCLEYSK